MGCANILGAATTATSFFGRGYDRKIATTTEPTENGQRNPRLQPRTINHASRIKAEYGKQGLLEGSANVNRGILLGKESTMAIIEVYYVSLQCEI